MIDISLHKFKKFDQMALSIVQKRITLFSKKNNIFLSYRVRPSDCDKTRIVITFYCYPEDQIKINKFAKISLNLNKFNTFSVEYKDRRR